MDELPSDVRELIDDAEDVLVVAPMLPSKLRLWTNDTDRAREQADGRLRTILGHVSSSNPERPTEGVVGDEVPMSAFDDAVRLFSPDHILVGLRSETHSSWQERDLVRKVRGRFGLPVTVVEIDDAGRVAATHAS